MQLLIHLALLALLLGASLAPGAPAYARAAQDAQPTLKDITEKIQHQKKKIKQVEKEEAEVIGRLNEIEERLRRESKNYAGIEKEIRSLQDDIRKARTIVRSTQQESRLRQQAVDERLNALYKYYRRSGLRILLSSRSYNDLIRTEKALSLIIERDRSLLGRALTALERQQRHEAELQSRRARLVDARTRIAQTRDRIKSTQQERSSHLNKIQREKSLQLKALKELEEHARRLQQFIDRLPESKKGYTSSGAAFSKMAGRLAFPVKGDIISRFGRQAHPELKTYTYQKGITIRAPAGTPVRAVHDGRVAFADWFKGYGYMIIVDHGEHYYSLSAHASRLLKKVDDIVIAGEEIAQVGDTSSIRGAGLYFEIRHHGKPQDPLKWLKKGGSR